MARTKHKFSGQTGAMQDLASASSLLRQRRYRIMRPLQTFALVEALNADNGEIASEEDATNEQAPDNSSPLVWHEDLTLAEARVMMTESETQDFVKQESMLAQQARKEATIPLLAGSIHGLHNLQADSKFSKLCDTCMKWFMADKIDEMPIVETAAQSKASAKLDVDPVARLAFDLAISLISSGMTMSPEAGWKICRRAAKMLSDAGVSGLKSLPERYSNGLGILSSGMLQLVSAVLPFLTQNTAPVQEATTQSKFACFASSEDVLFVLRVAMQLAVGSCTVQHVLAIVEWLERNNKGIDALFDSDIGKQYYSQMLQRIVFAVPYKAFGKPRLAPAVHVSPKNSEDSPKLIKMYSPALVRACSLPTMQQQILATCSREYFTLSDGQNWFLTNISEASAVYHAELPIEVKGSFETAKLVFLSQHPTLFTRAGAMALKQEQVSNDLHAKNIGRLSVCTLQYSSEIVHKVLECKQLVAEGDVLMLINIDHSKHSARPLEDCSVSVSMHSFVFNDACGEHADLGARSVQVPARFLDENLTLQCPFLHLGSLCFTFEDAKEGPKIALIHALGDSVSTFKVPSPPQGMDGSILAVGCSGKHLCWLLLPDSASTNAEAGTSQGRSSPSDDSIRESDRYVEFHGKHLFVLDYDNMFPGIFWQSGGCSDTLARLFVRHCKESLIEANKPHPPQNFALDLRPSSDLPDQRNERSLSSSSSPGFFIAHADGASRLKFWCKPGCSSNCKTSVLTLDQPSGSVSNLSSAPDDLAFSTKKTAADCKAGVLVLKIQSNAAASASAKKAGDQRGILEFGVMPVYDEDQLDRIVGLQDNIYLQASNILNCSSTSSDLRMEVIQFLYSLLQSSMCKDGRDEKKTLPPFLKSVFSQFLANELMIPIAAVDCKRIPAIWNIISTYPELISHLMSAVGNQALLQHFTLFLRTCRRQFTCSRDVSEPFARNCKKFSIKLAQFAMENAMNPATECSDSSYTSLDEVFSICTEEMAHENGQCFSAWISQLVMESCIAVWRSYLTDETNLKHDFCRVTVFSSFLRQLNTKMSDPNFEISAGICSLISTVFLIGSIAHAQEDIGISNLTQQMASLLIKQLPKIAKKDSSLKSESMVLSSGSFLADGNTIPSRLTILCPGACSISAIPSQTLKSHQLFFGLPGIGDCIIHSDTSAALFLQKSTNAICCPGPAMTLVLQRGRLANADIIIKYQLAPCHFAIQAVLSSVLGGVDGDTIPLAMRTEEFDCPPVGISAMPIPPTQEVLAINMSAAGADVNAVKRQLVTHMDCIQELLCNDTACLATAKYLELSKVYLLAFTILGSDEMELRYNAIIDKLVDLLGEMSPLSKPAMEQSYSALLCMLSQVLLDVPIDMCMSPKVRASGLILRNLDDRSTSPALTTNLVNLPDSCFLSECDVVRAPDDSLLVVSMISKTGTAAPFRVCVNQLSKANPLQQNPHRTTALEVCSIDILTPTDFVEETLSCQLADQSIKAFPSMADGVWRIEIVCTTCWIVEGREIDRVGHACYTKLNCLPTKQYALEDDSCFKCEQGAFHLVMCAQSSRKCDLNCWPVAAASPLTLVALPQADGAHFADFSQPDSAVNFERISADTSCGTGPKLFAANDTFCLIIQKQSGGVLQMHICSSGDRFVQISSPELKPCLDEFALIGLQSLRCIPCCGCIMVFVADSENATPIWFFYPSPKDSVNRANVRYIKAYTLPTGDVDLCSVISANFCPDSMLLSCISLSQHSENGKAITNFTSHSMPLCTTMPLYGACMARLLMASFNRVLRDICSLPAAQRHDVISESNTNNMSWERIRDRFRLAKRDGTSLCNMCSEPEFDPFIYLPEHGRSLEVPLEGCQVASFTCRQHWNRSGPGESLSSRDKVIGIGVAGRELVTARISISGRLTLSHGSGAKMNPPTIVRAAAVFNTSFTKWTKVCLRISRVEWHDTDLTDESKVPFDCLHVEFHINDIPVIRHAFKVTPISIQQRSGPAFVFSSGEDGLDANATGIHRVQNSAGNCADCFGKVNNPGRDMQLKRGFGQCVCLIASCSAAKYFYNQVETNPIFSLTDFVELHKAALDLNFYGCTGTLFLVLKQLSLRKEVEIQNACQKAAINVISSLFCSLVRAESADWSSNLYYKGFSHVQEWLANGEAPSYLETSLRQWFSKKANDLLTTTSAESKIGLSLSYEHIVLTTLSGELGYANFTEANLLRFINLTAASLRTVMTADCSSDEVQSVADILSFHQKIPEGLIPGGLAALGALSSYLWPGIEGKECNIVNEKGSKDLSPHAICTLEFLAAFSSSRGYRGILPWLRFEPQLLSQHSAICDSGRKSKVIITNQPHPAHLHSSAEDAEWKVVDHKFVLPISHTTPSIVHFRLPDYAPSAVQSAALIIATSNRKLSSYCQCEIVDDVIFPNRMQPLVQPQGTGYRISSGDCDRSSIYVGDVNQNDCSVVKISNSKSQAKLRIWSGPRPCMHSSLSTAGLTKEASTICEAEDSCLIVSHRPSGVGWVLIGGAPASLFKVRSQSLWVQCQCDVPEGGNTVISVCNSLNDADKRQVQMCLINVGAIQPSLLVAKSSLSLNACGPAPAPERLVPAGETALYSEMSAKVVDAGGALVSLTANMSQDTKRLTMNIESNGQTVGVWTMEANDAEEAETHGLFVVLGEFCHVAQDGLKCCISQEPSAIGIVGVVPSFRSGLLDKVENCDFNHSDVAVRTVAKDPDPGAAFKELQIDTLYKSQLFQANTYRLSCLRGSALDHLACGSLAFSILQMQPEVEWTRRFSVQQAMLRPSCFTSLLRVAAGDISESECSESTHALGKEAACHLIIRCISFAFTESRRKLRDNRLTMTAVTTMAKQRQVLPIDLLKAAVRLLLTSNSVIESSNFLALFPSIFPEEWGSQSILIHLAHGIPWIVNALVFATIPVTRCLFPLAAMVIQRLKNWGEDKNHIAESVCTSAIEACVNLLSGALSSHAPVNASELLLLLQLLRDLPGGSSKRPFALAAVAGSFPLNAQVLMRGYSGKSMPLNDAMEQYHKFVSSNSVSLLDSKEQAVCLKHWLSLTTVVPLSGVIFEKHLRDSSSEHDGQNETTTDASSENIVQIVVTPEGSEAKQQTVTKLGGTPKQVVFLKESLHHGFTGSIEVLCDSGDKLDAKPIFTPSTALLCDICESHPDFHDSMISSIDSNHTFPRPSVFPSLEQNFSIFSIFQTNICHEALLRWLKKAPSSLASIWNTRTSPVLGQLNPTLTNSEAASFLSTAWLERETTNRGYGANVSSLKLLEGLNKEIQVNLGATKDSLNAENDESLARNDSISGHNLELLIKFNHLDDHPSSSLPMHNFTMFGMILGLMYKEDAPRNPAINVPIEFFEQLQVCRDPALLPQVCAVRAGILSIAEEFPIDILPPAMLRSVTAGISAPTSSDLLTAIDTGAMQLVPSTGSLPEKLSQALKSLAAGSDLSNFMALTWGQPSIRFHHGCFTLTLVCNPNAEEEGTPKKVMGVKNMCTLVIPQKCSAEELGNLILNAVAGAENFMSAEDLEGSNTAFLFDEDPDEMETVD